jgi:hypothetical protein
MIILWPWWNLKCKIIADIDVWRHVCGQELETTLHWLLIFSFSKQVWHAILSWLCFTCLPPDREDSLFKWWSKAKQHTPKTMRKCLGSVTLLTPWMIWKHQNDCLQRSTTIPEPASLTNQGGRQTLGKSWSIRPYDDPANDMGCTLAQSTYITPTPRRIVTNSWTWSFSMKWNAKAICVF